MKKAYKILKAIVAIIMIFLILLVMLPFVVLDQNSADYFEDLIEPWADWAEFS